MTMKLSTPIQRDDLLDVKSVLVLLANEMVSEFENGRGHAPTWIQKHKRDMEAISRTIVVIVERIDKIKKQPQQDVSSETDTEIKVSKLLDAIEEEKRQAKPNKRRLRSLHREIVQLKEDWRTTHTGQDAHFQTHTSMRPWRDDA